MARQALLPRTASGTVAADRRIGRLIDAMLLELRGEGRKAIRIVHAGCGSGADLIRWTRRALALGFVAVEARGFDRDEARIGAARRAADGWRDPRLGLVFEKAEIGEGLALEGDHDVDLLLCARAPLGALPTDARSDATHEIRRIADRLVLVGEQP